MNKLDIFDFSDQLLETEVESPMEILENKQELRLIFEEMFASLAEMESSASVQESDLLEIDDSYFGDNRTFANEPEMEIADFELQIQD